MPKIIKSAFHYLFLSNVNDPIRQYCKTEFKKDWKSKYFELTGRNAG